MEEGVDVVNELDGRCPGAAWPDEVRDVRERERVRVSRPSLIEETVLAFAVECRHLVRGHAEGLQGMSCCEDARKQLDVDEM